MRTIETKVYTYAELSDDAKAKARDWYRSIDDVDLDCTIDDAKMLGARCGFDIDHIYYRGFWSQGDGACFEGRWRARDVKPDLDGAVDAGVERIRAALAEIAKSYPHASFTVKQRGHYMHENCTDFDHYAGDDSDVAEIVMAKYRCADDEPEYADDDARERWLDDYPEDEVTELARDFMRWIYSRLENDYEWQNSDEVVAESIIANEYEFTENGKRF